MTRVTLRIFTVGVFFVVAFFGIDCVYAASNLLVNPGGELGTFEGWTVNNGGSGWNLTFNGTYHSGNYSFMSSYTWGYLSQEINLVNSGYTTTYLDSAPQIDASVWVIGYFNTSDYYQFKVELRDGNHNIITSYDTGNQTTTGSWQQLSHTFTNYGSGVRYINFLIGGDDIESWGGQYGAVFDDASVTVADAGYVVTNPPSGTTITLTTDWSTNVASTVQTGTKTVGIIDGSYRVATFDVDFSINRDWTNLTADSNGTQSVMHYPGGFNELPGSSGVGFTLYIPDKGGSRVRICPGATTVAQVSLSCNDGYFLNNGAANLSRVTENGVFYWKVSGLTSTGGQDGGGSTNISAPLFTNTTIYLTLILSVGGGLFLVERNKMRIG